MGDLHKRQLHSHDHKWYLLLRVGDWTNEESHRRTWAVLSHKHIVIKSTKMCSWCWNSSLPGATVGTRNKSDVVACQPGPPHWPGSQCINPPFVKIHRPRQLLCNTSLCVVREQTFDLLKSMNEEFSCLPHCLLFCSSAFGFRPALHFSVS